MSARPTVVVTGIAGNLGQRLLPLLNDYSVLGLDIHEPRGMYPTRFEQMDLAAESSCDRLTALLRETRAAAVVHLAFVIDPVRTGILDVERMWQINVAGTARVMEAITEVNRTAGATVAKFIFPSSVSAYGSELPFPVPEDYPLGAHTLPYAMHKQEVDDVVRMRASSLGQCAAYVLRPHIFTGATMDNYLVSSLRGTVGGTGKLATWLRARGTRLPMLLPRGEEYLVKRFQFLHVDDMARLVAWLLHRPDRGRQLVTLNVAGRGNPVSLHLAARIAGQKIVTLPSRRACRSALQALWKMGISSVPPQALPYMIGSYLMDTARLRALLGNDYAHIIRYTNEEALEDTFAPVAERQEAATTSASA